MCKDANVCDYKRNLVILFYYPIYKERQQHHMITVDLQPQFGNAHYASTTIKNWTTMDSCKNNWGCWPVVSISAHNYFFRPQPLVSAVGLKSFACIQN